MQRRIARSMLEERLRSVSALSIKIAHSQEVLGRFLDLMTVDFTSMFRDPAFFAAFRTKAVPLLRERRFTRLWHAGCASGEEVYSMAILLEEEGLYDKTMIYATDMNATVLQRARRGIFPISRMREFTRGYQASGGLRPFSEYYTAGYGYAILSPSLQRNIVWAQHNLARDGKFSSMDAILCRNVLIYFNQDLKDRVHRLFFDCLEQDGILGLGSQESIHFTPRSQFYAPLDEQEKLYRKTHQGEAI
jgi:chemotaxis protein methyltransferase CheR